MIPLLLNEVALEKIQKLKEFAEENPLSMDDLLDMKNGALPPAGDMQGYSCFLNFGYKIVFTTELQVEGTVRHTSISVDFPKRLPSIQAVKEIITLLGFDRELERCLVEIEKRNERDKIIHVAEIIK